MSDLDLLVEMFAKVGKITEQDEIKKEEGKEYTISAPSFVVDAGWLNSKSSMNKSALKRLIEEMERTGIDRQYSLQNFAAFIKALNEANNLEGDEDVGKKLAKLNIIRVIHNLARTDSGRQSAAGFSFENFLAIFYKDGNVIPTRKKKKEEEEEEEKGPDNIADVSFGSAGQASIKFLSSGGNPTIAGSIPNLLHTIEKHGYIDYIVGLKSENKVEFKHTRITGKDLVEQSPDGEAVTPDEILQDILTPEQQEEFAELGPILQKKYMKDIKGRVDFKKLSGKSGKLVQQWMRYNERVKSGAESARKPKETQMNFSLRQLKFRDIGTLNTGGEGAALEKVNTILESLNQEFNDLLSNLQELSKRVNELTYSGDSERKSKATKAADAAGETKKSAEEIE